MRPTDLFGLLRDMAGRRVLIVGDALLDVYVRGTTSGLSREAPVPVVAVGSTDEVPGAAANAAANVAALGGVATLLAVTGADPAGARLRAVLAESGVQTDHLVPVPDRRTVVKRRVVADGQLLVRLDEGSTDPVGGAGQAELCRRLPGLAAEADAVVVCDYGYGTVTEDVAAALAGCRSDVRVLVLDAKNPRAHRRLRPTVVKPNYGEAVAALGLRPVVDRDAGSREARARQVLAHGAELLDVTGAGMVVVTMDADGAVLFEPGRPPFRSAGGQRPGGPLVGAGDVFGAAVALALAAGADPPAVTELAAIAAATAGDRAGTALCSRAELGRRLGATDKVLAPAGLASWAESVRARGSRIVLTNGCFDLLHEGHVIFLSQAKALGDVLVVGVNDDASVRRLKGDGRPVVDLAGRLRVLAALSCVDQVVPFGADTATALIDELRPDVYVKGGDYTIESLPETGILTRLGVRVHFLDYVPERSSTRLIERIQACP